MANDVKASRGRSAKVRRAKRVMSVAESMYASAKRLPKQEEKRKVLRKLIIKNEPLLATHVRASSAPVVCELVAELEIPAHMLDKKKRWWITITTVKDKKVTRPIAKVKPAEFGKQFSRYTALAGLGFCFEVDSRPRPVFVRRHTSFVDPLRYVVRDRNAEIVKISCAKFEAGEVLSDREAALVRKLIKEAVDMAISCGRGDGHVAVEDRDKRKPQKRAATEFSSAELVDDREDWT